MPRLALTHQRDVLLDIANALNDQFAQLAKRYPVSLNAIWDACHTARYGIDSGRYHEQSSELETLIGEKYEEIEDAVLSILEKTHRCSSMVENLNSRARPYLDEQKYVNLSSGVRLHVALPSSGYVLFEACQSLIYFLAEFMARASVVS